MTIELGFEETVSLGINVKRRINDSLSEKRRLNEDNLITILDYG